MWEVTEIGRQCDLVTGVLTTADAVTDIAPGNVIISLALYLTLYVALLVAYIRTLFYMADKSVQVEEYSFANSTPDLNLDQHQPAEGKA